MLRIRFVLLWFGLSDLAMEEALFESALFREFVGLSSVERIPDRVSILRFRQLLEEHRLAPQVLAVVNATLAVKGLIDVTQASQLVHGEETDVFANAGYQGVDKRAEVQGINATWHVAMRLGKRRALDKDRPMGAVLDKLEHLKASIRAKVEHPFRVVKRQFGHTKVRYRGLTENTAQLHTLLALSNLWTARRRLLLGLQT